MSTMVQLRLSAGARFGILSFLCIVGLAVAMGGALSTLLTRAVTGWEWENTAALARRGVELAGLDTLFTAAQNAETRARWERELRRLTTGLPEVVRIKVWDPQATVLWSDEARLIGQRFPDNDELQDALKGTISVEVKTLAAREHAYERDRFPVLAEIYVPIVAGGRIVGVVEIYKTPVRLFTTIRRGQIVIWTISLAGALALYLVLVPLVRQVYGREVREQTLRAYAHQLETQVAERTRELEQQRAALSQAEKVAALGQLVAGVAHELNNPLTAIIGHTEVLQRRVEAGPIADRLAKVADAGERCRRIVRNFLGLARQNPPVRQHVSLNRIVEEAAELFAYQFRVDDIEAHLDLATELPRAWADPHQLQQVLVNLLSNAQYAVRQTPPPRRVTLLTGYDAVSRRVRIEVRDTGPGVPIGISSRIFDPFFTTKPAGQGTGLGLSLCRGIVEAHGGTLTMDKVDAGASFVLELPLGTAPAGVVNRGAESVPSATGRKKALVVDDEPGVAVVLADLLAEDGHDVETVDSGTRALGQLDHRSFDLIFVDIKMPGLDGRELYYQLERRRNGLTRHVIFMTGDAMNPETIEFLRQVGKPILGKPFSVDEIRRAIQQVSAS